MIHSIGEGKTPQIVRFEATYPEQVKHDKVNALIMRIGAGAAAIGSIGFIAVGLAMGGGAIVAGLTVGAAAILALAAIVAGVALAILSIALLAAAHEKNHEPSLAWVWHYKSSTFDAAKRSRFDLLGLGRYGLVSKETLQIFRDFDRRFKAIPGALKGEPSPQYDAAYDALNTEWRKVIVPKIEADLPYPFDERRLAMKAHELYMKL